MNYKCRCCGQETKVDWQPSLHRPEGGYWLITCMNKECDLYYYTFSSIDYETKDLTNYLKGKDHENKE